MYGTKDETLHNADGIDLYKKMIEEIQDYAIIMMDINGMIRNWNKGAEKIKKYSESEVLGKHFSIFYLQEDLDRKLPELLLYEARTTGRATQEGWRKRKDGTKFWASITITAIHNDSGDVIGFSKVTRDLSEKKLAEDNLRISEERYHKMIAEVQDYAIILMDVHGVIENWNAGAEKIKGYTAREIVGKSFENFYTKEDREAKLPQKLMMTAHDEGKAVQEGWRVRKDGTKFWGKIVITALHDKDGSVIGFSKVTRDLTQQKIAEDKLNAYMRELEIQNSELEQFAYVASHDLQEPLRKIQTFTELIMQNYGNSSFVERYFEKLNRSAIRMSELVKSLLEYSRLSRQKRNSDLADADKNEEIDLNMILTEVKQDFELLINEKKATITSTQLPVIKGNKMQIGQIFSNLISNSLKFSKGDPVIHIASDIARIKTKGVTTALFDAKHYKISFTDNGIGFEQEYEKQIFVLFQRLHGKQDFPGTGIGLAICKKIAENHGGAIEAHGKLGEGSTFILYLPVK